MSSDEMSRFWVHLTGETLGVPGTPGSLRDLLGDLPAASVVQSAAKIVHHLERPGQYLDRDAQLELLELFPQAAHETLREMLTAGSDRGGVDVLFHRQQMLTLQKAALAAGAGGPAKSLDPAMTLKFIEAAAQVNDITDSYTSAWMKAAHNLPVRDTALWKLRNVTMNRNVVYATEAGRAQRLWADTRVSWPDAVEHPEDYAQRRFGCSLDMALAIIGTPAFTALLASAEQEPAKATFEPAGLFSRSAVDGATAGAVLQAVTYQPGDPSILDEQATYYGWADVAARPCMPAGGALLTASSPAMVFVRATTGVYWMLHAELAGSRELHPLTEHYGRMFEDYVLRLAELITSDNLLVSGEVTYGSPERKSSDVLICQLGPEWPARVFVEASTTRPKQPVFETGDIVAFESYLTGLTEKLGQLDRSITDHMTGRFAIDGDPLTGDPAYLPVLVVDEPFAWSPELRDLIDSRVATAGLFRQQVAAKPVVCSVGEWEAMIHHMERGGDLVDILRRYLARGRDVPLELHLASLSADGGINAPEYVRNGFREMTGRWLDVLQLPDDDSTSL